MGQSVPKSRERVVEFVYCGGKEKKKKQRAPGKIGRMEDRKLGVNEEAPSSDIHQKRSVRPSRPPVTH